jgi:uncharacterized membrane protein YphA (DoxX/SURF4 family)
MTTVPSIISKYSKTANQKFKMSYYRNSNVLFWLYHVVRLSISILFIWSGISKLYDPASFAVIIEAYGLIPDLMIIPLAVLLPLAEVTLGVGLTFDIKGSLASITMMLLCFVTILLYGIWLGLDIDCGCFDPGDPEAETFHGLSDALFRDIWLVVGIMYLYLFRYIKSLKPIELRSLLDKFKSKRS